MNLFPNNVAINVQVFGSFMEHRIGSYVEGPLVITTKNSRLRALILKVSKKKSDPLQLTSDNNKTPIFSLHE